MTLSSLSIRYPVPALMLFILLGVLGFIGLERLGIQDYPDLDLPVVTISASLEGAAPEQLETEVARKLEDRLSSLRLLKHMATTITSGNVQINVSFAIEKDGNERSTKSATPWTARWRSCPPVWTRRAWPG